MLVNVIDTISYIFFRYVEGTLECVHVHCALFVYVILLIARIS